MTVCEEEEQGLHCAVQEVNDSEEKKHFVKWIHSFWAPEWHRGLRHCISVKEASLHSLIRIQAVSHPAVIGSPIGRRTIGPVLSGVDRHCK